MFYSKARQTMGFFIAHFLLNWINKIKRITTMHTFLIIPCDKIPHDCDHSCCRHSNDNQFIVVDGYHNNILVAPAWVDDSVLIYSNEYTKEQFDALASDTGSIWYAQPEELI